MHHAKQAIDGAFAHWKVTERRRADQYLQIVSWHSRIDPGDLSARNHQALGGHITHAQGALKDAVLHGVKHAGACSLRNHRLDVFFAHFFAVATNAEQSCQSIR